MEHLGALCWPRLITCDQSSMSCDINGPFSSGSTHDFSPVEDTSRRPSEMSRGVFYPLEAGFYKIITSYNSV